MIRFDSYHDSHVTWKSVELLGKSAGSNSGHREEGPVTTASPQPRLLFSRKSEQSGLGQLRHMHAGRMLKIFPRTLS